MAPNFSLISRGRIISMCEAYIPPTLTLQGWSRISIKQEQGEDGLKDHRKQIADKNYQSTFGKSSTIILTYSNISLIQCHVVWGLW